jgi:hypothetical protein
MDMIRLNSQFKKLPIVFAGNLLNDFFEPIINRAVQNLPSPLGTPNDVIHDQVYCMLFVLILHVDKYIANYNGCQYLERPLCPSPKKGTPILPRFKKTGLSGPLTVSLWSNASLSVDQESNLR